MATECGVIIEKAITHISKLLLLSIMKNMKKIERN